MRLKASFIFRLRWKAGGAAGKDAAAHAGYVATRRGVARADEDVADEMDALLHPQYLAERPGSTGLFGQDPQRPPALQEVQDEVRDRPWHWQAVLSLREDDAQVLGMAKPADWRDLTRRILPRMAHAAGVAEGDLRWVAAMHRKEGHPHVHVLAWVREGAPDRGPALDRRELKDVRRAVAAEIYGPLRAQLSAERTAARDALVLAGRLTATHARRLRLESERLAPAAPEIGVAIDHGDVASLAERLTSLTTVMPRSGRVALAYMPAAVRQQARDAADWLLACPSVAKVAAKYEQSARDLAGLYSSQPTDHDAAWKRAREDVRDRIAQVLLRAAADCQTDRVEPEPDWGNRERAEGPSAGIAAPRGAGRDRAQERAERQQVRVEMRLRDPANALAYWSAYWSSGSTEQDRQAGGRGLVLLDDEHRGVVALLRRIEVERDEQGWPQGVGGAFAEAVALVLRWAPGLEEDQVAREVALQAARQQGLRANDPLPPTPADALAKAMGLAFPDEHARERVTEALRAAEVQRGERGRLEMPEPSAESLLAVVRQAGVPGSASAAGAEDALLAEAALAAYRQQAADARESRRARDLSPEAALAEVAGVPALASREIARRLVAVELVRDLDSGVKTAHGPAYDALLRDVLAAAGPKADRYAIEREVLAQAERAQGQHLRPAEVVLQTLGVAAEPSERQRVAALLRRVELSQTQDRRITADGPRFRELTAMLSARSTAGRRDVERVVTWQAARAQRIDAFDRRRAAASVIHSAQTFLAREARRAEIEAELASMRDQAQREARTGLERW